MHAYNVDPSFRVGYSNFKTTSYTSLRIQFCGLPLRCMLRLTKYENPFKTRKRSRKTFKELQRKSKILGNFIFKVLEEVTVLLRLCSDYQKIVTQEDEANKKNS